MLWRHNSKCFRWWRNSSRWAVSWRHKWWVATSSLETRVFGEIPNQVTEGEAPTPSCDLISGDFPFSVKIFSKEGVFGFFSIREFFLANLLQIPALKVIFIFLPKRFLLNLWKNFVKIYLFFGNLKVAWWIFITIKFSLKYFYFICLLLKLLKLYETLKLASCYFGK